MISKCDYSKTLPAGIRAVRISQNYQCNELV